MYSIMPPTTPPTFSFGRSHAHRPTISSPLSSSPIRGPDTTTPFTVASSPPPLSPCDANTLNTPFFSRQYNHQQRETQSSPITHPPSMFADTTSIFNSTYNSTGNNSNNNSKFRFASRPARPNPVLKRREEAQESRRRLFLQNVRQRAEEKRWEMRGGEDELLKLEWWRLNRERRQAAELEGAAVQYLADVEQEEEEIRRMQAYAEASGVDVDAMMADAIAQQEEEEMNALVSGLEEENWQGQRQGRRPGSPHFSDDDDYDELFMDLISQQDGQGISHSQDVEMT